MKTLFVSLLFILSVLFAAHNATQKQFISFDFSKLHLGMTKAQVLSRFGEPTSVYRNNLIYILDDSSVLRISFRDQIVTSAEFKYKNPPKIEESSSRKLTLVQMQAEVSFDEAPKWFFAGNPKDGLIYKISSVGKIETLTWVPPFTFANNKRKQLQALYNDFRVKQTSRL